MGGAYRTERAPYRLLTTIHFQSNTTPLFAHCPRLHSPLAPPTYSTHPWPRPLAPPTWSCRKSILAWLMMCSTTMEEFPKVLWFLEREASASTPSVSTTTCRYSGSGRLFRTLSTRRANFSSPGVIWRGEVGTTVHQL